MVLLGPPASGKGTQADFYKRRGILARVDADRGAESVFNDVSRLIIE